jgi:hypothetical protein
MDCAELNGGRPGESPDYEFTDLHRGREIELVLASCFERLFKADDVPTNPVLSVPSFYSEAFGYGHERLDLLLDVARRPGQPVLQTF